MKFFSKFPSTYPTKLRVGFDARMVYYRQAGIGQYILNLLSELTVLQQEQADFELVVLQSRKEKLSPAQWLFENRRKLEFVPTAFTLPQRNLWTPPHHRWEQWALPLETGLANLDVLHSPDFIPPFTRWRWKQNHFGRFAAVITIHDLAFLKFPHLLTEESRRYYGQVKQAAASAERVIAVSKATAHDVEIQLGVDPAKIRVVYEAANPLFRPLNVAELDELARNLPILLAKLQGAGIFNDGSDSTKSFILFVSTIEPRKNLATLLKAFRQWLTTFPAATDEPKPVLVLAGREGWLFEDIFRLANELGLRPNRELVWLGGVSTEELIWLYNKAACLATPSLYEGFGLPPLEALACGTPVLVANTSSLPEVVGALGQLIAPQDVAAWAEALAAAWREREVRRAQMWEAGPAWAKSFSWRKAAVETLEIYKDLRR